MKVPTKRDRASKKNMKANSSRENQPTFVDIFAGCGGLSVGLIQAGWKGVFAVEQDSYAFSTLEANLISQDAEKKFYWPAWLPKTAHSVVDVLERYRDDLVALEGKIDLIVGGPPCQGFSSAGRRDPNDPRNKLVESYLEFVSIIKPKMVLIENVKGITHDFDDIESGGKKINYAKWIVDTLSHDYHVSTRMIDTSTFGVPQRRHRFFIIGIRHCEASLVDSDVFGLIEKERSSFLRLKNIASVPVSSRSAISDLEVTRNGKIPSRDSKGFEQIAYGGPLTSYQRLMNGDVGDALTDTRLARHRPDIVARFEKIIRVCHEEGRLNITLSSELKASFGLNKGAIRVLDPDSPSPTITSMPDDLLHYKEPRALTVRENARLQSFPDWFVFKGKYTTGGGLRKKEVPRFTQVANAVPPLVAEAIGLSLAGQLKAIRRLSQVSSSYRKVAQKDPETLKALV